MGLVLPSVRTMITQAIGSRLVLTMRILVAGWHGQVARALSERSVVRDDVTAIAVGRPAFDLSSQPSIGRSLFGIEPDVIIKTATYTDVDGAEDNPDRARQENAIGAANLAADAARRGIPIIHLSTAQVFDGNQIKPYMDQDLAEPVNSYGLSKLAGERAVASANSKHLIVKTGWIYSPFGQNFVTTLLQRARTQANIDFVADQTALPTYSIHLADALLELAATATGQQDTSLFGTYHIAGAGCASGYDVATKVIQASADQSGLATSLRTISYKEVESRSRRPQHTCLDNTKVKEKFSIYMPNWQDGIEECIKRIL